MITPKFSCTQDDNSLTISLYVPSVRASEVEIDVSSSLVTIHVNPYFLRLNFSPSSLIEDDDSSAQFDPSSGFLTVVLTKEVKGEEIKDLDLLGKLMRPVGGGGGEDVDAGIREEMGGLSIGSSGIDREAHVSAPLIEVVASTNVEAVPEDAPASIETDYPPENDMQKLLAEREIFLEAEKNDWQLPQSIPSSSDAPSLPSLNIIPQRPYGFLDAHSGYFRYAGHVENEVNELGESAENSLPGERARIREEREEKKWDEDYYVADLVNDEDIMELVAWKSPYHNINSDIEFTDEEKATMLRLPRKEYLITPTQNRTLYLTLLTILFSYAYDMRTTLGDPTTESAWTMGVLTPCFAALDVSPSSPQAALRASYRRVLAFPLYRSWALAEACRLDVADMFAGGRRMVLRALLQAKGIMDKSDVYYVYSKIWLDDYSVWIQSAASEETLRQFGEEVGTLRIPKESLGWRLDELERIARDEGAGDGSSDSDDESENEIERMIPAPL